MEQQLSNARTRIIELTGELQSSRTEAKRNAEEAADLRQELEDARGTLKATEGEDSVCSCILHLHHKQELQDAPGTLQAECEHSACLRWGRSAVCHSGTCCTRPRGPCRPARVSTVHTAHYHAMQQEAVLCLPGVPAHVPGLPHRLAAVEGC